MPTVVNLPAKLNPLAEPRARGLAKNATGNYVKVVQRIPVRIRFDKDQDPGHQLRPGMSVEPVVYTK